jgi:hypothetical protein
MHGVGSQTACHHPMMQACHLHLLEFIFEHYHLPLLIQHQVGQHVQEGRNVLSLDLPQV